MQQAAGLKVCSCTTCTSGSKSFCLLCAVWLRRRWSREVPTGRTRVRSQSCVRRVSSAGLAGFGGRTTAWRIVCCSF